MSDEQLDETSISQGHCTLGICDEMCMLMCEFEESDLTEISNKNLCLQLFGCVALVQREKNTELTVKKYTMQSHSHQDR